MGGLGSGNHGARRVTVEGCSSRVLAVSDVLGRSNGKALQGWNGSRTWKNPHSGETTGLRFRTVVNQEDREGFVELEHEGRDKAGGPQSYRVLLRTTEQPFGGLRWWFWCPRDGRRVVKLYLPRGAARFASREAYELAYQCQRETPQDRAYRRAWKRRETMGGKTGVMLGTPIGKPPRRHWSTWDRDEAKLAADVQVCDRFLILSAIKLGALKGDLAKRALLQGFERSR